LPPRISACAGTGDIVGLIEHVIGYGADMNPWDDPRIARGMQTQLVQRRARIAAGDSPLGWKVGFGAPAAMAKLGIAAPLVGHLMQSALVPAGATISLAGWTKPVAEPEIAVHMGRDLAAGTGPEDARLAIAALGPAIELADLDRPPDDVEQVLSGNIYQRRVVLGMHDASRAGAKVDGLTCRVFRRSEEYARTDDPQAATGALLGIVRHVADLLGAFGERLRAGDIIITGSVVPPLFVEADEKSVAFALDPVGEVSVCFRP
jgi:2-keto-4-pentenoate hydratase